MNLDCHYYGTYYVALKAGFSGEDAHEIAWAAQTVDECHIDNLEAAMDLAEKKGRRGDFDRNFIMTVLDTDDDVRHSFSANALTETAGETNQIMLAAVRAIWMPFHFLPGNCAAAVGYGRVERYNGEYPNFLNLSNPDYNQNMHDMMLICRSSSETCRRMIRNAKEQYDLWKDRNRRKALFAVGIAMHVLADTWSHEFFVGSPNGYINGINSERKETYTPEFGVSVLRVFQGASQSPYTYEAIGHGLAGYIPDIPYRGNEYKIYHAYKSKCREGDKFEYRNNRQRFYRAFQQMLSSMRYIAGGQKESGDDKKAPDVLSDYEMPSDCLSPVRELFETRYEDKWHGGRREPSDEEGLELWRQLLEKHGGVNAEKYLFLEKGIDSIIDFMEMAKNHREGIVDYVESWPGLGRIFSVQSARSGALLSTDGCVRKYYNKMSWFNTKVTEEEAQ